MLTRLHRLLIALALAGAILFAWLSFSTSSVETFEAIPSTHATTAVDMFIKIDDIPGEATDKDHKDWIDILSFENGIDRETTGRSGSARSRSSATLSDIKFSKEIDKSTPKLQEAVLVGLLLPAVQFEITTTDPNTGKRVVYYQYELKNVQVTSYSISGNEEEVPTEDFSLNYEEIKVTYTEYDQRTGEKKGNVEYTWKVEKGTK